MDMGKRSRYGSIILAVVLLACHPALLAAPPTDGPDSVAESAQTSESWRQWNEALAKNWAVYRHNFIQEDGRVIDHRIGISTSEGQSYAMLRAVWMRDREWFDKTYQWAVDNLQVRKEDKLFAWKWGQRHDGSWGPMDETSASDANQDIVLALLLAHKIWQEDRYLDDARAILDDIWEYETVDSPIGRVLLPGDWDIDSREVQINPSYFSPYAYRIFDDVDRRHSWDQIIDSSYRIIDEATQLTDTGLPPDWVEFSLKDGTVKLYRDPLDTRSDYGYEAIRVYWRLALDYLMNPDDAEKARELITRSSYLPRYWRIKDDLPGATTFDGIQRRKDIESGAVYGAALPALHFQNPAVASEVINERILPNLKPGAKWNTQNDYYSQNWLWFGLALHAMQHKRIDFPWRIDPLEKLSWILSFE